MRANSRGLVPLLVFALMGLSASAMATSLMPQTAGQLADKAELIFAGTAVHKEVAVTEDGTYAYTFVTFEVDEVLKGAVDGAHLTLRFDGGDLDEEIVLEVEGMPRFDQGQRYLLFVGGNGQRSCPVVGWSQGKLDYRRHPRTGEDVLVDRTGALIQGLEDGQWRRSSLHMKADGTIAERQPLLAEVVSEEGVEIVDGPVLRFADKRAPAAEEKVVAPGDVLAELRQLLDRRSASKSFTEGETVGSASPLDIPASKIFHPVTADEEL